jgi:hypothetical protein
MHNTDMINSVPGTSYLVSLLHITCDVRACYFVRMDQQISVAEFRGSGFHSIVSAYLQRGVTSQQDRQCTYKPNTETRSRNHTKALMINIAHEAAFSRNQHNLTSWHSRITRQLSYNTRSVKLFLSKKAYLFLFKTNKFTTYICINNILYT